MLSHWSSRLKDFVSPELIRRVVAVKVHRSFGVLFPDSSGLGIRTTICEPPVLGFRR